MPNCTQEQLNQGCTQGIDECHCTHATEIDVTCWDGSTADNLQACPPMLGGIDPETGQYTFNPDIGWEPESSQFFDDPTTLDPTTGQYSYETDEGLKAIYDWIDSQSGGGYTGLTYLEWAEEFGSIFQAWGGSSYQTQTQYIEEQLAMLPYQMDLSARSLLNEEEALRLNTSMETQQLRKAREAARRSSKGLVSTQLTADTSRALDYIMDKASLQQEQIDIDREDSLVRFQAMELGYMGDLENQVFAYDEAIWATIADTMEAMRYQSPLLEDEPLFDEEACIEQCAGDPSCENACLPEFEPYTEGEEETGPSDMPWYELLAATSEFDVGQGHQECIDECLNQGMDPTACIDICSGITGGEAGGRLGI